jgi:hypothetical protein
MSYLLPTSVASCPYSEFRQQERMVLRVLGVPEVLTSPGSPTSPICGSVVFLPLSGPTPQSSCLLILHSPSHLLGRGIKL